MHKIYIFRKILAKKRTRFAEAKTFIIGNRTTSVIVIDGDGQTEFNDKNINIFATECCPFEIPEEVQECYKNTVLQLKKMKEEGKNVPWNGSTLSLYKYTVSRTANYEDYKIDIFLLKCDYYMTYSTIHNLDVGEKTLRSKYIETYNFENNEIYVLPNSVGICLCASTKDEKLIFAVRSADSGYRPGESDISVVEGLNPQYDLKKHKVDIMDACNRAIYEEIGNIDDGNLEVSILGLVFDKQYNQWNLIGHVNINMTQDEIITRRNSGTSGRWELKHLDFVELSPNKVLQYLSTHKMWDTGVVATYFTLVHKGIPKEKLERYFKKYQI